MNSDDIVFSIFIIFAIIGICAIGGGGNKMGDHNTGFLFTESAINIYDKDKLDKETLEALIDALKNATDPDFGDACEVQAKDGLTIDQIVCKVIEPEFYEKYGNDAELVYDLFKNIIGEK